MSHAQLRMNRKEQDPVSKAVFLSIYDPIRPKFCAFDKTIEPKDIQ